jgi:hypothetical protein
MSSAIGLNLIASVVFGVVFSLVAGRVQTPAIEDNMKEGFAQLSHDLHGSLVVTNRLFLPNAAYPPEDPSPSRSFGSAYNLDLTNSMRQTSTFMSYTLSGRQLGVRLLQAPRPPQRVKLALLDPTNRGAIISNTTANIPGDIARRSPEEMISSYQSVFFQSLVALFDCRVFCPIEIVYHNDVLDYRYVLLDDAVYLTWYKGPMSEGRETPESYRFASDAFVFKTLRSVLTRRFHTAGTMLSFRADDNDGVIVDHLSSLRGASVTPNEIRNLRKEYKAYSQPLSIYLQRIARMEGDDQHPG